MTDRVPAPVRVYWFPGLAVVVVKALPDAGQMVLPAFLQAR